MTQERLLETALDQFGRLGFDGASTREIARASGTSMSSITYHFGGKEGLYLACAHHITEQIRLRQAGAIRLAREAPSLGREELLERLLAVIDDVALMMLHEDSAAWSCFIVREQQQPTQAFELLYSGVMEEMLEGVEAAIGRIRPELASREIRALALTLFGQVLVLRAARATVCRALGVARLGEEEGALLRSQIRTNSLAILTGGTQS